MLKTVFIEKKQICVTDEKTVGFGITVIFNIKGDFYTMLLSCIIIFSGSEKF